MLDDTKRVTFAVRPLRLSGDWPRRWLPKFLIGVPLLWLAALVASAALAPLFPLAEHSNASLTLTEPGYAPPDLSSGHPLGTNNLGLDLLARTLYGARVSLTVGITATMSGLLIGGTLGTIAGYAGGLADTVIRITSNALMAFPPLILLLALASALRPSIPNIVLALAILTIPIVTRLARANSISVAKKDFVIAARALGTPTWKILLREVAPNVAVPLLAYSTVLLANLIVAEASLSFLGLSMQPPYPTWGNMIAEGNNGVMQAHPYIVVVPGMVLFLTVLSLNVLGERVRVRLGVR